MGAQPAAQPCSHIWCCRKDENSDWAENHGRGALAKIAKMVVYACVWLAMCVCVHHVLQW